jgi:hypothetical protein
MTVTFSNGSLTHLRLSYKYGVTYCGLPFRPFFFLKILGFPRNGIIHVNAHRD